MICIEIICTSVLFLPNLEVSNSSFFFLKRFLKKVTDTSLKKIIIINSTSSFGRIYTIMKPFLSSSYTSKIIYMDSSALSNLDVPLSNQ